MKINVKYLLPLLFLVNCLWAHSVSAGLIHHNVKITNNCKFSTLIRVGKFGEWKCELFIPPGETHICHMGSKCVAIIKGEFYKLVDTSVTQTYSMGSYNINDWGCHDFNITIKDIGGYACAY